MSEARELFPVTFLGGERDQPGMADFSPGVTSAGTVNLDAVPDPEPEDLEKIEEIGLDVPADPDQLEIDFEGIAAAEAAAAAATPVVEDTNKGKVPPA